MAHMCKALVFRCMDFRIKLSVLSELLAGIGYLEGTYDLVSVAGASKDCLSVLPTEAEFLMKQVDLSLKLHCIKEVIILSHDNCGAYGIPDQKQEHEVQIRDLGKISTLIAERFTGLAIKTYIIHGTATGDLSLEACQ